MNIEFILHAQQRVRKIKENKLYFKDESDPIPWIIQYRRLDSTVWPIRAPEFVRDSGLDVNRPKRNRKCGTQSHQYNSKY